MSDVVTQESSLDDADRQSVMAIVAAKVELSRYLLSEIPECDDVLALSAVLLLDQLNPYTAEPITNRNPLRPDVTEVTRDWPLPGTSLVLSRVDITTGDNQEPFSVYAVMEQAAGAPVRRLYSTDLDAVDNSLSPYHKRALLSALDTLQPGYGEALQSHFPEQDPAVVKANFVGRVETAIDYLETLQVSGEGFDALLDGHQQVLHGALYEQFVSLTGLDVNGPFICQEATYHGEAYTVSVVSENTSMNSMTCTVYDQQGAIVFEAGEVAYSDDNPNSGFHIFQSNLDNATILEVAKAYCSGPDTTKTGIESVAAELKRLGDFAPEGSTALVAAESLLRIHDTAEKSGELYSLARTADGGLSVKDASTQRELVAMSPDGKVGPSTLTPADKASFRSTYNKLQQLAATPQQTAAPAVKAKADLER